MNKNFHPDQLTEYETRIISGLQQGKKLSQVAKELEISPRSVRFIIDRLVKLNQSSETAAN